MTKIEGIDIDGKSIAQIIKDARADERAKIAKQHAVFVKILKQIQDMTTQLQPRVESQRDIKTPTPASTPPALSNGNGHRAADTVLQSVHKFIATQGAAQDAKSVVAGTNIPEPSVRWAFVKLMEAGSLRRESRGRYAIAPAPQEEHENLN